MTRVGKLSSPKPSLTTEDGKNETREHWQENTQGSRREDLSKKNLRVSLGKTDKTSKHLDKIDCSYTTAAKLKVKLS